MMAVTMLLAAPSACGPKSKDANGNCMIPQAYEQQELTHYHVEIHAQDASCKDVALQAFIHGDGSYNGVPGISLNNAQVLPFDKETYLPSIFDISVPVEGQHEFMIEAIITMTKGNMREFDNITVFCAIKRNGVPISLIDNIGTGFSVVAIQEAGTYHVKCGAHG